MRLSTFTLVATLAIMAQAAPSSSQDRQLAPRQAEGYEAIGQAVAGLATGLIDMIRQASPQANLKQMAINQPTDEQKQEWMKCLAGKSSAGWFTETKCGDATIQMGGRLYDDPRTCYNVNVVGVMNAIYMGAIDVEVDHSPAFAKCWLQFWVEPMFAQNSRPPTGSDVVKTDDLVPALKGSK